MSSTTEIQAPAGPKMVEKFSHRRVIVAPAAAPSESPATVVIQPRAPVQKMVQKLSAIAQPKKGLRTDGPTLEEFVLAGYDAVDYPPEGYAERKVMYRFAKLRGTTAKTIFPDGSFFQWSPKRVHGGGFAPTTSMETSDAKLAEQLRQAAQKDSSIREAPSR